MDISQLGRVGAQPENSIHLFNKMKNSNLTQLIRPPVSGEIWWHSWDKSSCCSSSLEVRNIYCDKYSTLRTPHSTSWRGGETDWALESKIINKCRNYPSLSKWSRTNKIKFSFSFVDKFLRVETIIVVNFHLIKHKTTVCSPWLIKIAVNFWPSTEEKLFGGVPDCVRRTREIFASHYNH